MLVGPPGSFKSTIIETAADPHPDTIVCSDLNVQQWLKMKDEFVNKRYSALGFPEFEKIYQRHSATASNLEGIIKASNRASDVIRRIRTLTKKAEIERVALDVNDVIKEVIALVQGELTSHLVSLQLELAPTLPTIMADRVHLQQVVINLVMNGIEAMQSVTDRPRQLVIQSRQGETQQVHVSVTDCGVGISNENVGRLFEAFFTTKSSGLGMGLSICRSIIEAHGGRLWVTPNVPFGATFEFTLPVYS